MPEPFKIFLRLYCGDEIAMGPGKADLLDAIKAKGSISAAGRAMNMSYRRAWLLVDAMNRCWKEPLVATTPGGAHGSGARLTELGDKILAHYRGLQTRLDGSVSCPDRTALAEAMLAEPSHGWEGRSPICKARAATSSARARVFLVVSKSQVFARVSPKPSGAPASWVRASIPRIACCERPEGESGECSRAANALSSALDSDSRPTTVLSERTGLS